MKRGRFGSTELVVSEVGFGCARIGGLFQETTRGETVALLREALERGINLFDTAAMYSQGESERLLGEAFRGRRHDVVLASKVGYALPGARRLADRMKPVLKPVLRHLGVRRGALTARLGGTLSQDFSPDSIMRAAEQCLRRLQTDYLDILQLHSPPTDVLESGDFLAPLARLREQGKIRYFGVACERLSDALLCLRYPQISTIQVSVNLLDQRPLSGVLESAQAAGVAVIGRQCFASGLLAKPAERWAEEPALRDTASVGALQAQVARYQEIADSLGRPLAELALGYATSLAGVSTTLIGMRTRAHLSENLRYLDAEPLSARDRTRLAEAEHADLVS